MSFSGSSRNIRLEGSTLVAECQNGNGDWVESKLDLSRVLGNENGQFKWDDSGFSDSAQEITLINDNTTLQASLQNGDGQWNQTEIKLDDRITNNDGSLALQD